MPPDILHATIDVSGGNVMPGGEVTYTCDIGYVISGTLQHGASIKCQIDGTWQELPACVCMYCQTNLTPQFKIPSLKHTNLMLKYPN